MAEFQSYYSPEDVIAQNLRETAERTRVLWEQEMAHLRELAAYVAEEATPNAEFLHTLPDHSPPRFRELFQNLRANPQFGSRLEEIRATEQAVYLCQEICDLLRQRTAFAEEDLLLGDAEELSEHARDLIIYQRNGYADSAYLHFAPLLGAPRALYTHSFSAVCEAVYNGLSEFCILPIENSAEGQLNSFSRLIDRFELKTVATCDIPATDGVRSTRFALLRRDIVPLPPPNKNSPRYFACATPMEAPPSPAKLLQAAQLCGLELTRMDSRASLEPESGDDRCIHLVFSVKKGDLAAFLLYLSMEAPLCESNGIYFHLE